MAKFVSGVDVDGYTLEERLGRGGNGEVWRSPDSAGTTVALKLLTRGGAEPAARFRRESDVQTGELSGFPGLLPVISAAG